MDQVFDLLCSETELGWTWAESGAEIFVTLTRKGVVASMTPVDSTQFTRTPGTREWYMIH